MSELKSLLDSWRNRARASQFAHYQYATELIRAHYFIGIPIVILTAVVGGANVSSGQLGLPISSLALGGMALAGSVLAAVQTFLRSSERAGEHRAAGSRYGAIRRQIEQCIAQWDQRPPTEVEVTAIRDKLDSLAQEVPSVSDAAWERAKKKAAAE